MVKQASETRIEDFKTRLEAAEDKKQKALELLEEQEHQFEKLMEEYQERDKISLDYLLPSTASIDQVYFYDPKGETWSESKDDMWEAVGTVELRYQYGDPKKVKQLVVQSPRHGVISKFTLKGEPLDIKLLEPTVKIEDVEEENG
jgi:hypothetical protein